MAQILLLHQGSLITFPQSKLPCKKSLISVNSYPYKRNIIRGSQITNAEQEKERAVEKIRESLVKVDISPSSYDTAWVAMVPSNRNSTNQQHHPCFPDCLEWIKENQKADGSWGINLNHPSLVKDSLSSTLACVLALQKWNAGEQLVRKGIDFIWSNRYAVMDRNQSSPIGFDIIFPGMINYANQLGLSVPLDPAFMNLLLQNRDIQLQSLKGKGSGIGYFAEGLGESYEWEQMIKKEQRSNGSLFNSPSSTAAALIHLYDDKCFNYLHSLVQIHGKAVPAIYPFHIYDRLGTVDTIERLGISRYFQPEIKIVLDEAYRCWEQRDEDIFADVACCALAFRLLRTNGYQVSSDNLGEFADQEHFFNTVSPQFKESETITQLFRASQIPLYQDEKILDDINEWTSSFLRHKLLHHEINDERLHKEVEYAFAYPFDNLDRLMHRRGIELYHKDKFRMLKTSYRFSYNDKNEFLMFAQDDFNECQAIQREEVLQLVKWMTNSRIASVGLTPQILISSHFMSSAFHFTPALRDARIIITKFGCLGTVIDDLFDIHGSKEELLNLIDLLERWDGNSTVSSVDYSSKRVEIIFDALQEIINEEATIIMTRHGRCVKHQLLGVWRKVLNCMFIEWEWWKNNSTPGLEEFLKNGVGTIGTGICRVIFSFYGIEPSDYLYESEEYRNLETLVATTARLYNDYRGQECDLIQRKVNACHLIVSHSDGSTTLGEAQAQVKKMIESRRRELLQKTLQGNSDSVIPKKVIESLSNIHKLSYYIYNATDEFRTPHKIMGDIKDLLYDPLNLI